MNPKLEAIKQENPTLWNEIKEYFSPAGLRRQLREYQHRREVAEAKAATLREEIRLIKLKGETNLLESQRHKLKQNRNVEKRMPEAHLLNDNDVARMYNKFGR